MNDAEIVLRIYLASSGQWSGKLLSGEDELAGIAGCGSAGEVEELAYERGMQFDRIERV